MHARASLPFVLILSAVGLAACEASNGAREGDREPVLAFPEPGVDDPDGYEGYATRFFRGPAENTVQIYLRQDAGRVVHVWADAANESAAFTVRDLEGRPAPVTWATEGARVAAEGETRSLSHRLGIDARQIEIGWFLLGTMRKERDFQYAEWHLRPYGDPSFVLPELTDLVEALERLPAEERRAHLALLNAADLDGLRARLEPTLTLAEREGAWTAAVEHTSLDGRNRLAFRLEGDADRTEAALVGDRISVRALEEGPVELDVTVITDAEALTPLGRERLFNEAFEAYFADRAAAADSLRRTLSAEEAEEDSRLTAFRRLERQLLGLELLSSEEKLMASLPNYATYFGRDQMMSALMLEPIASVDLQELVIASVLRKVDERGHVSHEEALGGQAVREAAAEYAALIDAWAGTRGADPAASEERLAAARDILSSLQAVRENYHMVDDDFQLLVLVDRYLSRDDVSAERKRAFLTAADGPAPTRLDALARNMAFAAGLARPYAELPGAETLVGFFRQDAEGWLPGSWRDSRAGYGNGRWAMDVNVVWVPEGLAALERVAGAVEALGLSVRDPAGEGPVDRAALAAWLDDPASLEAAIDTWRGARRHFEVRLSPAEMRRGLEAALAERPEEEAAYWRARLRRTHAADRPLAFLALALDDEGRPIRAPSTDPATDLFLGDYTERLLAGDLKPGDAAILIEPIARPYPAGLFVDGLGPVIVNDAYARDRVRRRFRQDAYHSPTVVWGREVNLILLGAARRLEEAYGADGELRSDTPEFAAWVESLRELIGKTETAVEASGLAHNELWSYRIEGGELRPVRYGQSSDLQLWNVTDLAVAFLLDRLPAP